MDFDPSQLFDDDPRDFERIASIKESAQHLISALQIERNPEIERAILSYDPRSDEMTIPDFIRRNLQPDTDVTQIWIDTTVNRLTGEGEFALYVNAAANDGNTVIIGVTVNSDSDHSIQTALLVGEDEMPILDPVTKVELNRFLASIFTRSKTGNYSAFDEMDLKDVATLERLTEILSSSADDVVIHDTYILSTMLSNITDSLTYVEENGTPVQCDATIEHRGKASMYEITLSEEEANESHSTEEPEFIMQALDGIRTYTLDIDGERQQIPSTNDGLRVLDDYLAEKSSSIFTKSPEEAFLPEYDVDPSLTINIEATIKDTADDSELD